MTSSLSDASPTTLWGLRGVQVNEMAWLASSDCAGSVESVNRTAAISFGIVGNHGGSCVTSVQCGFISEKSF